MDNKNWSLPLVISFGTSTRGKPLIGSSSLAIMLKHNVVIADSFETVISTGSIPKKAFIIIP